MGDKKLFSILMPTFNDRDYIVQSIESVLSQSYENWQLVIIDDASTDGTDEVVRRFHDKRIKYLRQDTNKDQLNALLRGAEVASGDYFMFLHSDDLLKNKKSLGNLADEFFRYPQCDGFFADLITLDVNGKESGRLYATRCRGYALLRKIIIRYGGNPRFDPFVIRRDVFFQDIVPKYLIGNTIYYLKLDSSGIFLNLIQTEPWYYYRVYGDNYINSDIGRFVASNGPIRSIKRIFDSGYFFNDLLFRNYQWFRIMRKLGLWRLFPLRKKKKSHRAFFDYMSCWLRDFEKQGYPQIVLDQMKAVARSAENRIAGNKRKPLNILKEVAIYDGKDARQFFKDFQSGALPDIYRELLYGEYDHIVTTSALVEDAKRIVNFLALDVDIFIEDERTSLQ